MAPTLGYWNVRGVGNPIKCILKYVGQEFDLVEYHEKQRADGSSDASEWFDIKFKLGLPIPNLPYYIDGNLKITESSAILHHLARQFKLEGETEEERVKLDMFEGVLKQLESHRARLAYDPAPLEETLPPYYEMSRPKYQQLFDFFGDKWIIGDKLTYVDFLLYEALSWENHIDPSFFSKFPKAKEYMKRFENIPSIKKYMSSPSYIETPLTGLEGKWSKK